MTYCGSFSKCGGCETCAGHPFNGSCADPGIVLYNADKAEGIRKHRTGKGSYSIRYSLNETPGNLCSVVMSAGGRTF